MQAFQITGGVLNGAHADEPKVDAYPMDTDTHF